MDKEQMKERLRKAFGYSEAEAEEIKKEFDEKFKDFPKIFDKDNENVERRTFKANLSNVLDDFFGEWGYKTKEEKTCNCGNGGCCKKENPKVFNFGELTEKIKNKLDAFPFTEFTKFVTDYVSNLSEEEYEKLKKSIFSEGEKKEESRYEALLNQIEKDISDLDFSDRGEWIDVYYFFRSESKEKFDKFSNEFDKKIPSKIEIIDTESFQFDNDDVRILEFADLLNELSPNSIIVYDKGTLSERLIEGIKDTMDNDFDGEFNLLMYEI